MAARTTLNGKVGVIGTEGTIQAEYITGLSKTNPKVTVFGKACPFVPLVEEGLIDDPITFEMARRYIGNF